MESNELPPLAKAPRRRAADSPERVPFEKLFVNSRTREYVLVPEDIARKVHALLESQRDVLKEVRSDDEVEALLSASHKIAGANCHKTALFLMGDYSWEQLFAPDNDDPETAGHEYVEAHSKVFKNIFDTPKDFEAALFAKEPPFRISFFRQLPDGTYFADHSITVLGTTNKDRLFGFEKKGPYADTPFRPVEVTDVIARYLANKYLPGLAT